MNEMEGKMGKSIHFGLPEDDVFFSRHGEEIKRERRKLLLALVEVGGNFL